MADPRNFDEFYNGQRSFVIGGQTFHWRPLHWREWGELLDADAARVTAEQKEREKKIAALVKKGIEQFEAEDQVDATEKTVDSFAKVVDRCTVYLEPAEVEAFKAVMNDEKQPISYALLTEVLVWLREVQTPDRPTQTPVASSSGPGTTGATSQAA